MVFSSYTFLFLFLPIVLSVYFILPLKLKNYWLIVTSIIFYSWNIPKYTLILLFSSLFNWLIGVLISKTNKKSILFFGVLVNLLILVYFKYTNFIVNNISLLLKNDIHTNIILPLGISFYTFQGISYIIDVYREDASALKNPLDVLLYLAMFPQLVAGPIVRFKSISKEIYAREITREDIGNGFIRFVIGLSKKVILADTFGMIADAIFGLSKWGFFESWVGAISYTLQIYFDFSGYSDMAIGLGLILGFHFNENFNYPYFSKSITEFWRRWHMSLSSWFKDYVYIPLGGSRTTPKRHILNIFVVWLLTGIWHGANWTFICWGLYYGIFLLIEKFIIKDAIDRIPNIIRHFITMIIVTIGWVIFRSDSLVLTLSFLKSMFSFAVSPNDYTVLMRYLINYKWFFLAGIVFSLPLKNLINEKLKTKFEKNHIYSYAYFIIISLLFLLSVVYIISNNYNAFIYFQF